MGDGCPKKKEEEESAADQAGGGWWFWFCFCNKREMIMMVFPVVGAFVGEATYDNGQHGRGFVLLGGGGGEGRWRRRARVGRLGHAAPTSLVNGSIKVVAPGKPQGTPLYITAEGPTGVSTVSQVPTVQLVVVPTTPNPPNPHVI